MTRLSRALGLVVLLVPLAVGFSRSESLRVFPGPADPADSVELPARFRVGEPSFFRWLGRGGLDLPWRLRGPGVLILSYQIATPAVVTVLVHDKTAGMLQLLPGSSEATLVLADPGILRLRFRESESESEDRRRASFFRIQIDSSALSPTWRGAAAAAALPLLVAGLLLLARLPWRWSLGLALGVSLSEAYFLSAEPYASLRLVERLLGPVAIVGSFAAILLRRTRWSPWVYAAFLVGLLLRLSILLHPFVYHYDHQAHAGMVRSVLDRGITAFWREQESLQLELNVGEIRVAGEKRAFPYPSFFYIASAGLSRLVGSVDYAVMLLASVGAALEVLLVAWLAGVFVERERARAFTAWASALYPASYGVLTLVLYPTMLAHVAEVGALGLWARLGGVEARARRAWILGAIGATAIASSIHAGTFINFAVFFPFLVLFTKKVRPWILGGVALGISFLVSYRGYLSLVPVIFRAPAEKAFSSYPFQLEPPQQFAFMGGLLWPILGLAGLVLLRRSEKRAFVLAWLASFLALRVLRVALGPPGAHLKELQWVAPLVAIGIGLLLDAIAERARWLALALAITLLLSASWWVVAHERWILPVLRPDSPTAALREPGSYSRAGGLSARRHRRRDLDVSIKARSARRSGRSPGRRGGVPGPGRLARSDLSRNPSPRWRRRRGRWRLPRTSKPRARRRRKDPPLFQLVEAP
jgi:hypothetical protein